MDNIQKQFDNTFKLFFVFGIIFILGVFLFGKFNIFEQINKSPALVLLFLIILLIAFGYIFSKGFRLHRRMGELVEKGVGAIDVKIIIHPQSHPLLKRYLYSLAHPLAQQIVFYLGNEGLMIEQNSFNAKSKSVARWEEVVPYLTSIQYQKEHSSVILFSKVISANQEQFNPLNYLYLKPYPENIAILVNSDEEAKKVINYLRNLLVRYKKDISIDA